MILVIHEKDLTDNEESIIGVADSKDNAEDMINQYYGKPKLLNVRDIRDSGIEYVYRYMTNGLEHICGPYEVEITLMGFNLNEI
jgi:hypothetical protein